MHVFSRKLKFRLDVILAIVSILAALAGAVEIVVHITEKGAALEIADFSIDTNGPYPLAKIKLRNSGDSVAVATKVTLILEDPVVTQDKNDYSADIVPRHYNWLITDQDVKRKLSEHALAREVKPNDTDYVEFLLGLEQPKSSLKSQIKIKLFYNDGQSVETRQENIFIVNQAGSLPTFLFPNKDSELVDDLREARDDYTVKQILYELSARAYSDARDVVRGYLHHSGPEIRVAATLYFVHVLSPEAVPEIAKGLRDSDTHVREQTYNALVFQGRASGAVLATLMNDGEPSVREVAADLLSANAGPDTELLLMQHINDHGVTDTFGGQPIWVSASVIRALAKLGSQKIAPMVPELLKSDNLSVQLAAIDACIQLKIQGAIPLLVELLDSSEPQLHRNAHRALVQLTNRDHGESKQGWLGTTTTKGSKLIGN